MCIAIEASYDSDFSYCLFYFASLGSLSSLQSLWSQEISASLLHLASRRPPQVSNFRNVTSSTSFISVPGNSDCFPDNTHFHTAGETHLSVIMSEQQANEAEKNIEIWKVKKLIKRLEAARGNGTSMISLIIRRFPRASWTEP